MVIILSDNCSSSLPISSLNLLIQPLSRMPTRIAANTCHIKWSHCPVSRVHRVTKPRLTDRTIGSDAECSPPHICLLSDKTEIINFIIFWQHCAWTAGWPALNKKTKNKKQKKQKKGAALIIYDHSYTLTCQRQFIFLFCKCLQECLYRHIGVVTVTYVTQVPAAMLLYVQPYCRCHSDE
jgi:hypothetical protein